VSALTTRIASAIRRDGAMATASKASKRVGRHLFMREAHMWYALDLNGDRPRREFPDGFALRRGTVEDTPALADVTNQPSPEQAREYLDFSELYIVEGGGGISFACWIHPTKAPVLTAPGGWLALPEDVACLEDSGTNPEFRGKGVAPAAWTAIADQLRDRGLKTLITKVALDNEPSRKAVMKAGFVDAAEMHTSRTGPVTRVEIRPQGQPVEQFLKEALTR
jgi:RimJ/RimL family protein N-acetyltransferase